MAEGHCAEGGLGSPRSLGAPNRVGGHDGGIPSSTGDVAKTRVHDIPRSSSRHDREELAVRPRTTPMKASTAGVVAAVGQASATVEVGPPLRMRISTSRR